MPPVPVRDDVREALRERARKGSWPAVVVLPREIEHGAGIYTEISMYAVKDARAVGVDAEYLHQSDNRKYLGEHSASFLMAIAVSFAADLSANGLKMVGLYLLAQIRSAVKRGIVEKDSDTSVHISAAVVDIKDGDVHIEGLEVEGVGEEAVSRLFDLISDAATASRVKRELGIGPEQDASGPDSVD